MRFQAPIGCAHELSPPKLETVATSPDVFRFRDYRAYLRALYAHNKEHAYGFSLRAFSKRAGLTSSNYLKLVMDGDRNLTPAAASRFATACGLSGQAADYFVELVAFNQSKTADERARVYERLRRFRRYREVHRLDKAQAAYHGHWYVPAIRELCAREDFREDPKWIARELSPHISPAEARAAIEVLLELSLLERDQDGVLRQTQALVQTPDGPLSHHVVSYHRAMMDRAKDALEDVPRDEREIASLTLRVSDKGLRELKSRLERMREELLQVFESDGRAKRVVQVNFQMFPLTRRQTQKES